MRLPGIACRWRGRPGRAVPLVSSRMRTEMANGSRHSRSHALGRPRRHPDAAARRRISQTRRASDTMCAVRPGRVARVSLRGVASAPCGPRGVSTAARPCSAARISQPCAQHVPASAIYCSQGVCTASSAGRWTGMACRRGQGLELSERETRPYCTITFHASREKIGHNEAVVGTTWLAREREKRCGDRIRQPRHAHERLRTKTPAQAGSTPTR